MSDISQVKRQLDELVVSLNQRRTKTFERRSETQRELDALNQELEVLTKTLEALQPAKSFYSIAAVSETRPEPKAKATRVEPAHNSKAIVEILTAAGKPLRIDEIAKVAFEQEKLKSLNGYDAGFSTVSTA